MILHLSLKIAISISILPVFMIIAGAYASAILAFAIIYVALRISSPCFLCLKPLRFVDIIRLYNIHQECGYRLEYIRDHDTVCPIGVPLYGIFAKDGYYGEDE